MIEICAFYLRILRSVDFLSGFGDCLTQAGIITNGGTGWLYRPEAYVYNATTGNLASKAGVTYTPIGGYSYAAQGPGCPSGALSKAHAVTSAGSNTYCYDLITKER
jgi:hypothetical protein